MIAVSVKQALLPQLLERYDRGEGVVFGPITANRDGLAWKGRSVPWPIMVAVSVKRGVLTLECHPSP